MPANLTGVSKADLPPLPISAHEQDLDEQELLKDFVQLLLLSVSDKVVEQQQHIEVHEQQDDTEQVHEQELLNEDVQHGLNMLVVDQVFDKMHNEMQKDQIDQVHELEPLKDFVQHDMSSVIHQVVEEEHNEVHEQEDVTDQVHELKDSVEQEDADLHDDISSPACLQCVVVHVKRRCLVLDLNGLLLKRYRITYNRESGSGWVSDDISELYKVITPPKPHRRAHVQYVVRPDAQSFLQHCGKVFSLFLWSSCTKQNLDDAMQVCFPTLNHNIFIDMIGQDRCTQPSFKLCDVDGVPAGRDNSKPIFCKRLSNLWETYPNFNSDNTLLVDDTRYKSMLNPWHTCISPPSFEPEDKEADPFFLTNILMPWLMQWEASKNPAKYAEENMIKNHKDEVSTHVMQHYFMLAAPKRYCPIEST